MKFTNFGKKLFAFIAVLTFGLVLVSCGGGNDKEKAQHQANVQAVLDAIFFDETLLSEVKGDMTLVSKNEKYPNVKIEWTSSETDLIAADGKVTRPALEDSRAVDGKVKVTLTVTASQGEAKGTKTFEAYVLTADKVEANTMRSIQNELFNRIKDNNLVYNGDTKKVEFQAEITGKVVLLKKTDGFYFIDGTSLMYVYKSNSGVKVGDTVKVSGGVYAHYGVAQFGSGVSVEIVSENVNDLTFTDNAISEYTAELDAAKDSTGKVLDAAKMAKLTGSAYNLYAKLGKDDKATGTGDPYYLEDPYTAELVALYYYSTANHEETLDALVGKYVNIKVYTLDCYSSNGCYRALYSGEAISEAAAPTLTDAQKVASALTKCVLDSKVTVDVTLPVVENVVWTLKEDYANAVIENGVLKVTRPENGAGNAKIVLVATATIGNETGTKEIEVEVIEKEDSGIKEVKDFATDKAYKLGFYQGNTLTYYWITGEMSGNFGATSDNPNAGANVKVVAVDGGYQLQVIVGETVKYLELVQTYNEKDSKWNTNVKFVETSTFVWQYNEEHNTFTHEFKDGNDDGVFYMGTYKTYNTLSASKISYAATSFPSHLYEVKAQQGGGEEQPEPPVIENGLVIKAETLFVGCSGNAYSGYDGTHTVDGITYQTKDVMIANGSSAVNVEGYIQCKGLKDGRAGYFKNTTAYAKAVKTITFTFYNTYDNPNLPTIKAGATADNLTTVNGVLSGGTATGLKNSSGYEYKIYTITYTLPEGCYFWEYSDSTSGAKYFSQIVLGF